MIDTDKKEFKGVMIATAEIYGNVEMTNIKLQMYFQTLSQLTMQEVKHGLSEHMKDPKHGTFFPKPADIIRHTKAKEVSAEDRASLAWMEISRQIQIKGAYGTLKLDDKQALAAVKNIGGWVSICHSTEDQFTWKEKEFRRAYETFERTPIELLPASLAGIEEMHNAKLESRKSLQNITAGLEALSLNQNKGNQND